MEFSQYEKARYYYQSISQLKELKEVLKKEIEVKRQKAGIDDHGADDIASRAKTKSTEQFKCVSQSISSQIDEAIKNLQSEIEKL